MQVQKSNDVKIYNLSCGKSLPEWISERKRRKLQKTNVDIRRRIELIQDFDMPGVSTGIKMSGDGKYILATGIYQPRVRCYEVDELSMKFERCFNNEVVQFEVLSDDYSQVVFLQCDRFVEFHVKYGSYFKLRIPTFGRDMVCDRHSGVLYFVGATSDVYRLHLKEGRFLNSFGTEASSLNTCCVSPVSLLFACGTEEGKVEVWDPRSRQREGILDCAFNCVSKDIKLNGFPSITALNFRDDLTMAVGTKTGQILLYDIRSNKPFVTKDHMYGSAIKKIEFLQSEGLVASLDNKCVKFWDQNTGKAFTAIQPPVDLNDMCLVPNSGMLFLANEDKKILTYFIPRLGQAPRWCSFLDSITEEMEESQENIVYDDYKFVTKKELEELGLSHLIGSNFVRAYMHGYFIHFSLYNKARIAVQPSALKDFKKKKLAERVNASKTKYLKTKQWPAVNKELYRQLLEEKSSGQLGKDVPTALDDERFKEVFENPDFECAIDPNDEAYESVRPLLNRMAKPKKKSAEAYKNFHLVNLEDEDMKSESSSSEEDASESEEEEQSSKTKKQARPSSSSRKTKAPKLYEIKDSAKFSLSADNDEKEDSMLPLGERLQNVKETFSRKDSSAGSRVFTFTTQKSDFQKKREEHEKERRKFRRPAKHLRK